MKKNNIFLSLLSILFIYSCASNDPKYHKDEPTENFGYPTDKEIEKSFYLIGDGGYSQPGGSSEGLIAFKTFVDSVKETGNYSLFLGDNIYPSGLPPEDHPGREQAEYRLDAQLDAIENYDGKVIFTPGNHDWYDSGIPGLLRQEEYLLEKFEENLVWSPKAGCGLQIIDITDEIQMIVIDSQWYLEDWDKHPTINDDCAEIKTREA
ncbi:metallophosphoesterase, partial [Salegentibacter sp.]|uniref:metallophosphoesterase n=1 Tax=Salegentibacter sp. TaxID=1903072 RepID=UPI003564CB85